MSESFLTRILTIVRWTQSNSLTRRQIQQNSFLFRPKIWISNDKDDQEIEKEIRDVSHKLSANLDGSDIGFVGIIDQLLKDKTELNKLVAN